MPELTRAALTDLMVNDLGYDMADATGMVDELLAMQAPIKVAFIKWWQTGDLPKQPVYEGYSVASLVQDHHLQPIAAFLSLDWLATEPEIARNAISQGYDEILPG